MITKHNGNRESWSRKYMKYGVNYKSNNESDVQKRVSSPRTLEEYNFSEMVNQEEP
jgi:hypothetical protein